MKFLPQRHAYHTPSSLKPRLCLTQQRSLLNYYHFEAFVASSPSSYNFLCNHHPLQVLHHPSKRIENVPVAYSVSRSYPAKRKIVKTRSLFALIPCPESRFFVRVQNKHFLVSKRADTRDTYECSNYKITLLNFKIGKRRRRRRRRRRRSERDRK